MSYKTATFNYKGLEQIIRERFIGGKQAIIKQMKNTGKVASGYTISNINVNTEVTATGVLAEMTAPLFSFTTTETGRKAGKIPSDFISILYQWSIDKNIQFENERKRKTFAYFVARKIMNAGTRQYRLGNRDDIYTNEIKRILDDLKSTVKINDLFDIDSVSASTDIEKLKLKL